MAVTLQRLGWSVTAVNAQGHPDIAARKGVTRWLFEVEIVPTSGRHYTIKADDLGATRPASPEEVGIIAVFDWRPPARWILLENARAQVLGPGRYPLASLAARSMRPLSGEVLEEFAALVEEIGGRWRAFTYNLLVRRALDWA